MDDSAHDVNNESLYKATWSHRAFFTAGCATIVITLTKSALLLAAAGVPPPRTWFHLTSAALLGHLLADLCSGLFHWVIDNYGDANTPILGPQIESFLEHHRHPLEITKTETARFLHTMARITTFAVTTINIGSGNPVFLAFVGVFVGCGMFSLKFHAWAHTPRRNLLPLVAVLQDVGILLQMSEHSKHHRPPHNCCYCTVSGIWNRILDDSKVLVALEVGIFRLTGVRPRSWPDEKLVLD